MFDLAAQGSDAESKCDWRWLGVPPWEIQHECTKKINWSSPCWTRGLGKTPLTTMWQRERKPLSRTLGGEAENGDRT